MLTVDTPIKQFLDAKFPDVYSAVTVGDTGLTRDKIIVFHSQPIPIDGNAWAGRWITDFTCLTTGGDYYEFGRDVFKAVTGAVDSGEIPEIVSWKPTTLPTLVDGGFASRKHSAVAFAIEFVAYYD